MAFAQRDIDQLLAKSGRLCAVCKGRHIIQMHHIVPRSEGGSDDISNAIPVCPNCHVEVHAKYASGRNTRIYTEGELREHLQRTIEMAATIAEHEPDALVAIEDSRTIVLGETGLAATLERLYPDHVGRFVELWGVQMPICAFPAAASEFENTEAPLGRLVDRRVPSPEEYSESFDLGARSGFDRRVEKFRNASDEERRHAFSGPTYALSELTIDEQGHRKLNCVMGRYFAAMATSEDLDAEMMTALATDPASPVELAALPRRSWLHSQVSDPVTDGRHRSGAVSHATVVMVATQDKDSGYDVLLPSRSAYVHTHAHFCHVAPSGILAPFDERSPSPDIEFSVRRNFYREWVEELYAAEEQERWAGLTMPDPAEEPEVQRLDLGLRTGDLSLLYTGISVNLLTLRPEICLLLLVRNPAWWSNEVEIARASRPFKFGWEYAQRPNSIRFRSPNQSENHWLRLNSNLEPWDGRELDPTFVIPNAAAAIFLAIETVKAHTR